MADSPFETFDGRGPPPLVPGGGRHAGARDPVVRGHGTYAPGPTVARPRPGRHGALLALAGRLPAPILAERLGIHQAPAAQWARAAGATYSGYVELRA